MSSQIAFVSRVVFIGALLIVQDLFAANVNYRNKVLSDGATAYYEFDTSTPTDTAGGDNNGFIQGLVNSGAVSAPGLDTAYDFVGGNVRIPNATTFNPGLGAFTLELWYNADTDSRVDVFAHTNPVSPGEFDIILNAVSTPAGFTGSVGAIQGNFPAATVLGPVGANINQWHHLAVTRTIANVFAMYVDGTLKASGTANTSLSYPNDSIIGASYGGNINTTFFPFDGRIDEVAWYPVALTPAQISSHIALAVPEPNTLILAGAGLFAICFVKRRRGLN